jgi:hypothetical protein
MTKKLGQIRARVGRAKVFKKPENSLELKTLYTMYNEKNSFYLMSPIRRKEI